MKNLLILAFLFASLISLSQQKVVIEKNKKTAAFFSSEETTSFISVLQANSRQLIHYNSSGIEISDLKKLSTEELNDLIKIDVENGDSVYTDIHDIDKIELHLNDRTELSTSKRVQRIRFYKSFSKGQILVLEIGNGWKWMEEKVFPAIERMNEGQKDKWQKIINNKKFLKELKWEEVDEECEPCQTAAGKYGLCWRGQVKVGHKYDLIKKRWYQPLFEATYGDSTELIDLKGNSIFKTNASAVYTSYDNPGTFICQKGNYWSVYSIDGKYNFPYTEIEQGELVFGLDGQSYANLDIIYFVNTQDGLKGLINLKGEQILKCKYADLYLLPGFDQDYGTPQTKRVAVGRLANSSEWQMINSLYEPMFTYFADEYINIDVMDITFKLGRKYTKYDLHSGEKNPWSRPLFNEFRDYKGFWGVVAKDGVEILPPLFNGGEIFEFKGQQVCAAYNDRGMQVLFEDGNLNAIHLPGYKFVQTICDYNLGYWVIEKNGKQGVAIIDYQSEVVKVLIDCAFEGIVCTEEKGAIALGATFDDKIYHLFADGTIILVEE